MKLLLENWRRFLNEKKWEDFEHPKDQWVDIPTSDIKAARDPINVDLSDELYDLIDIAYKPIGGNFDFKNSGDLPGDHDDWTAIDIDADPEPDALRVSKTKPAGTKMTVAGHDGTKPGKDAYIGRTAELLLKPGYYAEMSKKIARIMIKYYNIPHVDDPEKVQQVLGSDRPIKWLGPHPEGKFPGIDGWYTRDLGPKKDVLKIMLGNPK
jgi:hypothetical protein